MRQSKSILLCVVVLGISLVGAARAEDGFLDKLKAWWNTPSAPPAPAEPAAAPERQPSDGGATSDKASALDMNGGLKEALKLGAERVVTRLGAVDGFNADPLVHIPLPGVLEKVRKPLSRVGMSGKLDELELRLNRAAEAATAKTGELFWNAIEDMSVEDALTIVKGPDDAATQYFRSKMSQPLGDSMRPIVDQGLSDVGALETYENLMSKYKSLPFVPDVKADLTTHVVDLALAGVFHYMAEEERAIRKDPIKRGTSLIAKVFGAI